MALVRFARRPSRIAFPSPTGSPVFPTFDDVENRVNRLFERAFTEPFGGALLTEPIGWVPPMDIVETAKELTLTAELPGLDQKDVDVFVEDGVVTIRGEKSEERKEEQDEKKVYLFERIYGSFHRSFTVPVSVDASKITADFEKGVLKVHMPKDAEVKPKGRKIEVKPL